MTARDPYGRDPYGDALRRALHAEADRVMPSPDALHLIRERTAKQSHGLNWAWLTGGWKGPLLASVAALGMAAVAVSATPAAIDRFSSAGNQSKEEKEAQQRKSAPFTTTKDGIVIGPDGTQVPSSVLRVTCVPISPSKTPRPTRTTPPPVAPSPSPSPSVTSCPPSTTPSTVPVPPPMPPVTITPSTTPQPTPPASATPTPTVVTPAETPTPTPQPTETPTAPEEPSPTATAATVTETPTTS